MKARELDPNKIIVADDDPIQRMLFSSGLSDSGYEVIEAVDGDEAIALFDKYLPAIIILDIEMPGIDGFEVCEIIRAKELGKFASILVTTGLNDSVSILRAYEAGATDFMSKPINWTIINHRIKYILRSNRIFHQLNIEKQNNSAIIDAIPDTIITLNKCGFALDYHCREDGLFANDILDKNIFKILDQTAFEVLYPALEDVIDNKSKRTVEIKHKLNDKITFFEVRLVASGDNALAIIRDITQEKNTKRRMFELAYYDSLTGLPNRRLFTDILNQEINKSKESNKNFSILSLDLNRFGKINSHYGHHAGDMVLKHVVQRLQNSLRKNESNNKLATSGVARFGGDEFVILLSDVDRSENLKYIANRIIAALNLPFHVNSMELFATSSIGIASYPKDGTTVDELLRNANTALKLAKSHHTQCFMIYNQSMDNPKVNYLTIESELRKAILNNELFLCYQPQVNVETNEVLGAEALIRWQHPKLGLVSPEIFIPIAEEIGIISEIGEWVIDNACKQVEVWQKQSVLIKNLGINLSSQQFSNFNLVNFVDSIISKYNIDPFILDFEITEGTIMHDPKQAIKIMDCLKELGVRLSIDDFGTGYSSLSYLKKFPVDKLKIDRSFVNKLDSSRTDEKIVKVILSLASALDLEVVAEGVENETQLEILRKLQCHLVQGYYFEKPLTVKDFEHFYFSHLGKNQTKMIS